MDTVRKLRKAKGWSQEHLAAVAGIGRATVQRIESGRRVPSVETAQALAQVLDADAADIRAAAGLAQAIAQTMEIVFERDPTSTELSRLPRRERLTFLRFCGARRELATASGAHTEAIRESCAAMEASGEAFAKQLDSIGQTFSGVAPVARGDARGGDARLTNANERLHRSSKAVAAAADRVARASTTFSDRSLALSCLLLRFA